MKFRIHIIIGFLFMMVSCDHIIIINGKVISNENGMDIKGAKINLVNHNIFRESDENGNFNIEKMVGRTTSSKIIVTHPDYKPFEIELKGENNFINYKIRKGKEHIALDKPFYPDPNNLKTYSVSFTIDKYSKNFRIKSDTLIFYLDEKNLKKEIDLIKENSMHKNSG